PEIDSLAVCRMLVFNHPPAPQTIWKNVYRLEPGSALEADLNPDGTVKTHRVWPWWNPGAGVPASAEPATDAFIDALREAVRRHLVSDVPLGVLLSGGVD